MLLTKTIWGWRFTLEKLSQTPPHPSDETYQKQLDASYNKGVVNERERIVSALIAAHVDLNALGDPDLLATQVAANLDRQGTPYSYETVRALTVAALKAQPHLRTDSDRNLDSVRRHEFERGHKEGYSKGYAARENEMRGMLDQIIADRVKAGIEREIAAGRLNLIQGGDAKIVVTEKGFAPYGSDGNHPAR